MARILIVDDDQDTADTYEKLLRFWGHESYTAYDGRTALSVAADFKPEVILLDIGLPAVDGYEVARRIRTSSTLAQTTRLIAISGYATAADVEKSLAAGFDLHMAKPIDPEALSAAIASLVLPKC